MMKRLVVATCMLVAACSANDSTLDDLMSDATSAIQRLEDRDSSAVESCLQTIESCPESAVNDTEADLGDTDAAADDEHAQACGRLSAHCDKMDDDLERIREPSVECWRGVKACGEKARGDCDEEAEKCDDFDDDIDASRRPVIDCAAIVERCLEEAEAAAETGEVCDAVAAACEAVGDLSADAEDARSRGDDKADDMCRHAHDAIPDYPRDEDSDHGMGDGDDGDIGPEADAGDDFGKPMDEAGE